MGRPDAFPSGPRSNWHAVTLINEVTAPWQREAFSREVLSSFFNTAASCCFLPKIPQELGIRVQKELA